MCQRADSCHDRDGVTSIGVGTNREPQRGNFKKEKEKMSQLFKRFVREEDGQDLIEYGLLIGIITVGCIVAINAIGPMVAAYFNNLNANLP